MIDLRDYFIHVTCTHIGFTLGTWEGSVCLRGDGIIEFHSMDAGTKKFNTLDEALNFADRKFKTNAYEPVDAD